jgi:hypothetical protein
LGIRGMSGNEGYWGGGISIISQNFPKSPSILFHPLDSSISQTSPECTIPNALWLNEENIPLHARRCKRRYRFDLTSHSSTERVFGSNFSLMTKINRLKNFSHTLFGG